MSGKVQANQTGIDGHETAMLLQRPTGTVFMLLDVPVFLTHCTERFSTGI